MNKKRKKRNRQRWGQPYQHLLMKGSIILMIWTIGQGNSHHIMLLIQQLAHLR